MQAEKTEIQIAKTLDSIKKTGSILKGSVNRVVLGKKVRSSGNRVAYLLTYKGEKNKTHSVYIKKEQVKKVQTMIQNYRKLRKLIDKLITLNVKLLKTE